VKLVVQSHVPLEIGKVYSSVRDAKGKLRRGQRIKVIAESSLQEWIECMRAFGKKDEDFWEQVAIPTPYHYEVQTD